MTELDLRNTLDSAVGTFIAMMVVESLVKPVATRIGRWLLHKLDHVFPAIPDWLSKHSDDEVR